MERSFVRPSYGGYVNFALISPQNYFSAMSGLGYQVIYNLLNKIDNVSCERFFFPDFFFEKKFLHKNLYSIESGTPLSDFDVIGFSLSYEMDYTRVPLMLSMAGIPVYSEERDFVFPLIIAGGAFSFYNPEPVAPFFDAIVLGEGEETLLALTDILKNKECFKDKEELFSELVKIEGIYIPHLYSLSYGKKISPAADFKRQYIKKIDRFDGFSSIITPETEFSNMFLFEVARGCKNRCKFCMVGHCFNPYREKSISSLKEALNKGKGFTSSVGLIAPSIGDFSYIDSLCDFIIKSGLFLSFSSLRADRVSDTMLESLKISGRKTITVAPETGSEDLRKKCLKFTGNDVYYHVVERSGEFSIKNVKLYFMIGLPGETFEDIKEIITFTQNIRNIINKRGGGNLSLSINQFIPKPGTGFERYPLERADVIQEKIKYLKKGFKKIGNIKFKFEGARWAVVQALLSLGDREVSKFIYSVSRAEKENFQAWKKAFKDNNMDPDFYIYRKKDDNELLPWKHICR